MTHKAILVGRDGPNFLVEVEGKTDGPLSVPIRETLELNQAHVFTYDVKGDIVLEDSLVYATKGKSEKAKLLEMTFKLAPLVKTMDFEGSDDDCYEKQLKAIRIIRSCLNFIANNVGDQKIMHADRATTGHVGKLSLRG